MGFKTGIWASRLEFGPRDWDLSLKAGIEASRPAFEPKRGGHTEENSRKSIRWSSVPMPCLSRLWLKLRGEQGSGPEGVDDLCFHTYGEFPPPPPSGIGPFGWDLDLKAEIWVSRLGSEPPD